MQMDLGAKDIIMVLLGFTLAWLPQWFDRRRKIVAHWAALRAEAMLCVERAHTLLSDKVMAPLYRLPTTAYEKAFPILLIEGEMTEEQLLALSRFFSQAQDINRGLDHATAMAHADDSEKLKREYSRLLVKATEIVGGADGNGLLSKNLFDLVNTKLEQSPISR